MPSDIVEKLRQERAEREKQRKADLEKYEKELALRREARKVDRLATREKEQSSDIAMRNLTRKTIEESFKRADIKSLEADLKKKEFESRSAANRNRRDADKELFNMRRKRLKDLALLRRKKKIPPRPKRYTIHPVEFYGIDFSVSTHIDSKQRELFELSRRREEEIIQNPSYFDAFMTAGNAFVKALAETTAMDHGRVEDLLRKKRFHGSLARISEVKEDEEVLLLRKYAEDMKKKNGEDDFWASSDDLTSGKASKDKKPEKGTAESYSSKKKWTESIQKNTVDYSEFFPSSIGMKEGISVFRIEDMKPVELSKNEIGTFCEGDAYVILESFSKNDGRLDYRVYQYVGEEASLDKKASSAVYAVGLKDMLNVQTKVSREESSNASKNFVNMFLGNNIDYTVTDATNAVDSGLFTVQEREYAVLMYRVGCKRFLRKTIKGEAKEESLMGDLVVELTSLSPNSLNSKHVYLIDGGLILYLWQGKSSSLGDKIQGKFLANRIIRNERPVGKADLFEVQDGREPDEFWDVFGGDRRNANECPSEMEQNALPCLYVFGPECESKNVNSIHPSMQKAYPLDNVNNSGKLVLPKRELLNSQGCAVLDCGNEIYFWTGRKSTLELREIVEFVLINKIYPLKERPEFCLNSKQMEGVENEAFKARFHYWENSSKSVDFSEVKATFARSIDAKEKYQKQRKEGGIQVDIKVLYSPAYSGKNTPQEDDIIDQMFKKANLLLQSTQCFIFEKNSNRYLRLPEWTQEGCRERCHFWSQETYVFLCIYKKEEEKTEDDVPLSPIGSKADLSEQEKADEEKQTSYECAIYLWKGRDVGKPSFGVLQFQFQFKSVLEELVSQVIDGTIDIKTVFLEQEKESIAFLAHLDREIVVHRGSRPEKFEELIPRPLKDLTRNAADGINPDNVLMYHVRTDLKYKVCRAVQVCPMVTSLCTRDIYIIMYTGKNGLDPNTESNTFVWVGKGASKEEERKAYAIVNRLVAVRLEPQQNPGSVTRASLSAPTLYSVVKEKSEPKAFWSLIAPTFERPTASNPVPYGQGFYYSIPPPRMFRCSTENGKFEVQDLSFNYTVSDLRSETVCLLDAAPGLGKPNLLWAWIGKEASDVVIKLAKKSADAYFDHLDDGRSLDRSEWDTSDKTKEERKAPRKRTTITGVLRCDLVIVREGAETADFKAFFLGWGDKYQIEPAGHRVLGIDATQAEAIASKHNISTKKEEPSNAFMRQQMKELEEYRRQKQKQVTATETK